MQDWDENCDVGCKFMPTEEEIAVECAKIRATWSPAEFKHRSGGLHDPTAGSTVNIQEYTHNIMA